ILAKALLKAGQIESAAVQFSQVLSRDADNLVALKYLGDIKFAEGDSAGAMALYGRILEIDPECRGIRSSLERSTTETTRTITLKRTTESKATQSTSAGTHAIPFFTETIGDLYLKQGHPRLAAQVFQAITQRNPSPRIADKLAEAEQRISEKDN
ncbi:MAG: tetratricopeptide repeat protein, partial [candidate division Zixibacteria bacterium]|nr:tetratricopeptide repeat protein [candidate division Zixibacteria bacterium]